MGRRFHRRLDRAWRQDQFRTGATIADKNGTKVEYAIEDSPSAEILEDHTNLLRRKTASSRMYSTTGGEINTVYANNVQQFA